MFRRLIKTTDIDIAQQSFSVRYYEAETLSGVRRYSSEIILGPSDRVILDGDSVNGLESKVACLVPATVYSRLLASRPHAA